MALTTAGRNHITVCLINDGSPTFFDNSNSYLAVGDSTTAFAVGQTDLQAVTNKIRKGMDTSYPTRTDNQLTFKATYSTSEANFVWNEWGIFNASTSGVMLNRKVESLGEKTSYATWVFTVTLTINAS